MADSPLPCPTSGETPNPHPASFDALLTGRRSVRSYRPDPVPEDELAAILETARWAPSPHNSEPWRFVVLRTAAAKERLVEAMGTRWADDLSRDGWSAEAIARELRISRRRITGAPIVVVACLVDDGLDQYPDPTRQLAEQMMAAHSLGAAVQNIMLAAYARGLGSGWMCAPLFCPEVVVATLALPGDFRPQGLITLGYPTVWPEPRERRPMPELVREAG